MSRKYLKKASKTSVSESENTRQIVREILNDIEENREQAVHKYAQHFDKYNGNLILEKDEIQKASEEIPQNLKNDIQFAHDNIKRFAQEQKKSLRAFEMEITPGVMAGQKLIPCQSVGCYIPGGRYSHVASALMTVTTAKVAGCPNITACSPPHPDNGINPAIIYAAHLAGADTIIAIGGVQGVATMTFGLFNLPQADMIVGPGNQFVAEAKRLLFGKIGIDMLAGPTDSLIIADAHADPEIIAADLVGQAEHGYNSPVWLVTTHQPIADKVMQYVPKLIKELPELNQKNAQAAWDQYAEVILCDTDEESAQTADDYAPEHLSVHAQNTTWWKNRLRCYGSLFLGEETTVAFGDKVSGPNHVLPTSRAARYTGGLSVHKYLKVVTWQHATRQGSRKIAEATARISRLEGMEAHAKTADIRLKKYFEI